MGTWMVLKKMETHLGTMKVNELVVRMELMSRDSKKVT